MIPSAQSGFILRVPYMFYQGCIGDYISIIVALTASLVENSFLMEAQGRILTHSSGSFLRETENMMDPGLPKGSC